MRTYLFDDKRSAWHAVLGFITTLVPWWLGVPLLAVYLVYEVREPENPVSTIGDLVEFIIGFMIGMLMR